MGRVGKGQILRIGAFAFGLALASLALNSFADDKKPAETGAPAETTP